MLTSGVNAPSTASATPASDSLFRASSSSSSSHPVALRASLQPSPSSSTSNNNNNSSGNGFSNSCGNSTASSATPTTNAAATAANPHAGRAAVHHHGAASSTSFSSVSSAPAPRARAPSSSSSSAHHASASAATHPSTTSTPSAPMTSHRSSAQRLPDRQRSSPIRSRHSFSQQQEKQQQQPSNAQEPAWRPQHQDEPPQQNQQGGAGEDGAYTQDSQASSSFSPASPKLHPTYCSARSLADSEATSPSRIKVRDLSHIQSFASEEILPAPLPRGGSGGSIRAANQSTQDAGRQYEISSMPVTDIIEMVAGLLTKITTTNDQQHDQAHRQVPSPDGANNLSPQASSVLAFHGKNIPAITILSYLSRIQKYCPTTYEVFLSLLVYFDRMTEMVNKGFLQSLQRQQSAERKQHQHHQHQHHQAQHQRPTTSSASSPDSAISTASTSTPRGGHSSQSSIITPPSSGCVDGRSHDSTLPTPSSPSSSSQSSATVQGQGCPSSSSPRSVPSEDILRDPAQLSQYFVVDSFNIHRLVIAGVTCASKFFSDVFYTNSRYAKVGGLPLVELNHLELQFLALNDFRLSIPVEELEAYGTMLVEFYAREVVVQQKQRGEEEQQQQQQQQQV